MLLTGKAKQDRGDPMGKYIDLTGMVFGRLTVLERSDDHILPSGKPRTMYKCRCECGNITYVSSQSLRQQTTVSCGCYHAERQHDKQDKRLAVNIGDRYGRLVVIDKAEDMVTKTGQIKKRYLCRCDCGNEKVILSNSLKRGQSKSCGCYKADLIRETRFVDITGLKSGKLTAIEYAYRNKFGQPVWKCKCECGSICYVTQNNLSRQSTKSCGCLTSDGERRVSLFLTEKNINFNDQVMFDDLFNPSTGYKLKFDYGIYDNDNNLLCLIEFQGAQHFEQFVGDSEFGRQQRNLTDQMKKNYCRNHNIRLYYIMFNDNVEDELSGILHFINVLHADPVPSLQRGRCND